MWGRKYYLDRDKKLIFNSIKEAFFYGCEHRTTFTIRELSNDFPVWDYVVGKNTFIPGGWLVKNVKYYENTKSKEAFLESKTHYAFKPLDQLCTYS